MTSVSPGNSVLFPDHLQRGNLGNLFKSIKAVSLVLFFIFCAFGGLVNGQTDFAPGQIMFTGYNSDDPDGFSIVTLAAVTSGTTIYITDRGWSNTTGFRDDVGDGGEGTLSFQFSADYPCGTTIVFTDVNCWTATDAYGKSIGTVTILTSTTESPVQDADGIEFNVVGITDGDQLFIYQSPEPTPANQTSFVTGIHMNGGNWNTGNGDDFSSQKPNGLANNQVVRFVTEVDNAKYDCTPSTGTATALQAAIENDNGAGGLILDNANNWLESNVYINLYPTCSFCCGSNSPVAAPSVSSPCIVTTNESFILNITGTLATGEVWELYTTGCGIGVPVQTTMSSSFNVVAPGIPGGVTYYIRSSQEVDCEAVCAVIHVIVEANTNTCFSCISNLTTCGDCYLPAASDNPDLDSGCYAIKLIFILDESGSINIPVNYEPQVRAGVLAFLNAINGQDMEVALIEFSDLGRVVNDYTVVNNLYISNITNYFDNIPYPGSNQTYIPGGGTNWHDAMIKADAMSSADIILFFTDGHPTGWTNCSEVDYCSNGSTTQTPEIVNPVKLANKLKAEDTHMFMLGVGNGVDAANLQRMSGPIAYQAGVNTIGTADYSIGNFEQLANDLAVFVNELCETPLELDKQVLGAICDGVQQFMFIIHNPGEESAATAIQVIDTFPSGYTNVVLITPPPIKHCIGAACNAVMQIDPPNSFPANAFRWAISSLPPGGSDTLIMAATVLPTGSYMNKAWADGSNTGMTCDTATGSNTNDDLPPTVSCPGNVTIECSEGTLPAITGNATGMDPDGSEPSIIYTDQIIPGSCTGEFAINRTWKATDGCNNAATCIQVIVAEDTTSPDLDCPDDITIQCNDNTLPANTGNSIVDDNCDLAPAVTYADVLIPGSCGSILRRTWTAEDDCGNLSTCVQVITIHDSTNPVLSCPSNVTIACSESTLPANTGGPASATDNCDPNPVVSYTDAASPGECAQEQIITRTWKALDGCGNFSTCNQMITVDDNSPPSITCPANVTIQCNESTLPANTGTATSTDNCNPFPAVTFTNLITNGSCPQEYTITRTWTAADGCGNSTSCIQMITVDDSTSPNLFCPANITIECTASTLPANTGNATATDNCDPDPLVSYSDVSVSGACPQEYTITRSWTVIDDCGNSTTCNQVIFIDDSTPPALTCPANITIECTENTLPANTGTATSTDNCDITPDLVFTDVTVSGNCPQEYSITRTWTTTDECGNSTACSQLIIIEDTTSPTITCPPNLTIECLENTLPANTGTPDILDACDPSPELIYNDVTTSGPGPNGHTIHRTWTTTDECGNTTTCIQLIIVENPIDPDITGLAFDTICSGQSVTFTAEQQNIGGEVYQWTFGSGSNPSSATGPGPHIVVYTYNASNGSIGASVLLTVSINGCASVTDTVANVNVNAIPNPAIMAPVSNLCYFKIRTFKPVAAQVAGFTYEWNFGSDASIPTITGYGPHDVFYTTTGMKTVQLIVFSNEAGASCGDTATISFNVISCPGNVTGAVKTLSGIGIADVTVRLFLDENFDGISDGGTAIRTVTTNPTGGYSMVAVTPGQYVVVETQPANYYSISDGDESNDNDIPVTVNDPNDDVIPVTLEPQEIDAGNVFIEATSPGIIDGYVFEDFDNDGFPDAGEGIANVTIYLYPDADQNGIPDPGNALDTVVTSGIGFFTFGEVANGDYTVKEVQPAGYNNGTDIDASNDADNVDNSNSSDDIIPVTIINGETDSHNFFKENNICSHIVASANDNGPATLRYIINCAQSGDTITFHPGLAGAEIHLNSTRIEFNKNIYIHSALNPRVRIYSDIPGAFKINAGFTAEFRNIDFTSGVSGQLGATFENYGQLVLWDVQLLKNPLLLPGNYLIYNGVSGFLTAKGGMQIHLD